MKKIIFFTVLIFNQAHALVCMCIEIAPSFLTFKWLVEENLRDQIHSIKKLESNVDDTTKNISIQNKLLRNESLLFKETILKQKEMIFELKKKTKLR